MEDKENKQEQVLEQFFIYRLIKVIYVLALLSLLLVVSIVGYVTLPYSNIDSENSSFICANGKIYSISQVFHDNHIDEAYIETLKRNYNPLICAFGRTEIFPEDPQINLSIDYSYNLNLVYEIHGNMQLPIMIWLIGIPLIVVLLNIIRETLIYLIYNRKFTWDWLMRPWRI